MTTTTWTTTDDIPLNAWTPMVADMRALLGVATGGGSTVTGPDGTGPAILDDTTIGFTVQSAPTATPMTVTFTRAAGTSTVTTKAATTGGLVLASLTQAARWWGTLLTWTTDADTKTRAVARELAEGLFGAGDRAVSGGVALPVPTQVGLAVAQAQDAAAVVEQAAMDAARAAALDGADYERLDVDAAIAVDKATAAARLTLPAYLDAVVADLTAQRAGVATAEAMLAPAKAPAEVVAQVRAELDAGGPEEPEKPAAAKKAAPRRHAPKAAAKPAT